MSLALRGASGADGMSSSFSVHSSVDMGRHLFILHLHVEVLKIINVVWCQFRDFRCKVGWVLLPQGACGKQAGLGIYVSKKNPAETVC